MSPGNFDIHLQHAQQQQMQQAAISQLIGETASRIYAHLVSDMTVGQASQQGFRDAAQFAVTAAPYIAEAAGLIKLQDEQPQKQLCPHDMEPHECNDCMRESDFQHDAAREGRMFGR